VLFVLCSLYVNELVLHICVVLRALRARRNPHKAVTLLTSCLPLVGRCVDALLARLAAVSASASSTLSQRSDIMRINWPFRTLYLPLRRSVLDVVDVRETLSISPLLNSSIFASLTGLAGST
jgi:hypothetical protein